MWGMEFSLTKCRVIYIYRKNPIYYQYERNRKRNYTIYDTCQISRCGFFLYWNSHIDRVSTTSNRTLGFTSRHIFTQKWSMAFKTHARLQLENASSVWSPYTKTNVDQIDIVQRRALWWAKRSTPSIQVLPKCNHVEYGAFTSDLECSHWHLLEGWFGSIHALCWKDGLWHTFPMTYCSGGKGILLCIYWSDTDQYGNIYGRIAKSCRPCQCWQRVVYY